MLSTPSPDSEHRGNLSEGKPRKPFLLLSFVLRRAPIILLIGGTLTLLFLLLLLPFVKAKYSTDGLLLLDPTKQVTVAGREQEAFPGHVRDLMRTMVERINTIDVLTTAIRQLKPTEYPDFFNPLDPPEANAARLMKHITVNEIQMTNLIAISISAETGTGLAPTLNRVMQAFVEKNQSEKRRLVERRINYLTQERDKIIARLDGFKDKWQETVATLPDELFINTTYAGHVNKLDIVRKQYLEARMKSDEASKNYQRMLTNREYLPKLNLQPLANEKVADNYGISRMELWTYEQSAELRKGIDGLTQDNSDRRNVEGRIQAMDDYLVNYKTRIASDINQQLKDKQGYELDIEVAKAKAAADSAAAHAESLRQFESDALQEYNSISHVVFDLLDIQFNTEQLRERLKALNTRIDDAEVEAMAPVQIFIDKVASNPTEPEGSNLKLLVIVSVLLGLGGVSSFILAFDMVDNRLRHPKEVDSALGGPGVDPIPIMEGVQHPPGSFVDTTLDWPRHPASMAIRALAVRLDLERENHGARVIALTGLGPSCGVTSLSLALAHTLKTHDRKVLVLECNLLRPGMAAVHGSLEEAPGLCAWLTAEGGEVEPLIQRDPRRQIDVITAGGLYRGIPDRTAFLDLLAALRNRYDLILLDTASVLEDELSFYAAVHADAALLVGREDISLYSDLRQTIDRLVAAGTPALGALLNFTRTKRGERIRTKLYAEMRWLSKKHWILHGMTRRSLQLLAGRGMAATARSIGKISVRDGMPAGLARWIGRLLRVPAASRPGAVAGEVAEIAPMPFMDGEISLPETLAPGPAQTCKWIYDKKRKVLINLTRKVKYPEGTYIYQSFGEENGFEIIGGQDVWVLARDVTFINQNK